MKLAMAMRQVHRAEMALEQELLQAGERHKADHDVFHVTRLLARRCPRRANALLPFAERYGAKLDEETGSDSGGPLAMLREKSSELLGRRPEPGLLLLRDLRDLHLAATETSLHWMILAQGAQAAKDPELLAAISEQHADELRVVKWATTRLKEAAPQVLMG